MCRVPVVVLAVSLISTYVFAQSPDLVEVFGGYSYMNPDVSMVAPSVSGWNASANFKVHRRIGIVADFSGFYPSYTYPEGASVSGKTHTFLFGPQVSMTRGRFEPFAHFLVGFTHVTNHPYAGLTFSQFTSSSSYTLAAGGGVDYFFTRRFAIRGQADWLHAGFVPVGGGDPGVHYARNDNVARISTGIVFRF
ncbi:MAG TPA: hypothetical protein VGS27_19045 [Candidatus Sulfotelmatobacter sp.]|nr:hypothetical protein [Candidatus Sulfotelmatobacter sp.]